MNEPKTALVTLLGTDAFKLDAPRSKWSYEYTFEYETHIFDPFEEAASHLLVHLRHHSLEIKGSPSPTNPEDADSDGLTKLLYLISLFLQFIGNGPAGKKTHSGRAWKRVQRTAEHLELFCSESGLRGSLSSPANALEAIFSYGRRSSARAIEETLCRLLIQMILEIDNVPISFLDCGPIPQILRHPERLADRNKLSLNLGIFSELRNMGIQLYDSAVYFKSGYFPYLVKFYALESKNLPNEFRLPLARELTRSLLREAKRISSEHTFVHTFTLKRDLIIESSDGSSFTIQNSSHELLRAMANGCSISVKSLQAKRGTPQEPPLSGDAAEKRIKTLKKDLEALNLSQLISDQKEGRLKTYSIAKGYHLVIHPGLSEQVNTGRKRRNAQDLKKSNQRGK